MKATLSNYAQSPRKVRLVTELVKGKQVTAALEQLAFLPKRAAKPIAKLVRSATANAIQQGGKEENLRIENITVDGASMLRRYRARAFGRGATIRHRRSHVNILLSETGTKTVEVAEALPVEIKKDTKVTEVASK
ncbi:MAG TPA: 50S ribosomal protein L22 [Candidatus Kaiserbacteria bacterium]|nr:50S ribosomal protein L22 [Candidatus Kaiserbacteria bacterium]